MISGYALADVTFEAPSVDTGWITQGQAAKDAVGIFYELVSFRTVANVNGGTGTDGAVDLRWVAVELAAIILGLTIAFGALAFVGIDAGAKVTRRIADGFTFMGTSWFKLIPDMTLADAVVRALSVDALQIALGDASQLKIQFIFRQLESFVTSHNVRSNTCPVAGIYIL